MDIDENLIIRVAAAARLELSDDEIKQFIPEIKETMEHFKVLNEADVSHVEPSFQPIRIRNSMREDKIRKSLSQEDALKNSRSKDGYFMGPSAI